ncbi:MAG: D-alanyl-D-alanine carboxypeptidase [Clostridia bacterium]|nr:D-alanyl-D-alanine carboxypeptidase [Clostridia bacterium]
MKQWTAVIAALSLLMMMTGCQAQGGRDGVLGVCGAILGLVCVLVAISYINKHYSYVKRCQRRGLPIERKLGVAPFALAVIGVITMAVAIMVWHTARLEAPSKPDEPLPPATATTTHAATTPTQPTNEPTFSGEPTWMTFPADRELTAEQYFVYSVDDKAFTTMKGEENEVVYPASITKLFTAYVALKHLAPTDTVTAGDALDFVVEGSSVAKIEKNDVLTAEMLVEAMLLPSGNDAAYILAVEVGRKLEGADVTADKAVARFVKEMNLEAVQCGIVGSNFVNPDGIHDDNHYMTYHDLGVLGALALENETIMKYTTVAIDEVTFESGRKVDWVNTNELVFPGSAYYCPFAKGLKTGQTPDAGSCLLSAFVCNGKKTIIGVFGCPEKDDRFADTLQLFNNTL